MSGSELKKSFGKRMFFLREHRRLTQEDVAGLLECSTTFERDLEKGREGPSFKMLAKLSNAFNIEVIDLLRFDESIPPDKTTAVLDKETLCELFGDRLRFLRFVRMQQQVQVARTTGLTASFIRMLETGKQGASFNTLAKLADSLDVDIMEFFRFGRSFPQDRHRAPEKPPEASSPSS